MATQDDFQREKQAIIDKNKAEREAIQQRVRQAEESSEFIEIYEWRTGEPRPGDRAKIRNYVLEFMEYPPSGAIPQKGDILRLQVHPRHFSYNEEEDGTGWGTSFVVLERHLMLGRIWVEDKESPPGEKFYKGSPDGAVAPYSKMWLMVRRLSEIESQQM